MVDPLSKLYTVSNELFYKYVGENIGFENLMPQVSMLIYTRSDVKLSDDNKGHYQLIVIDLCCFTNYPIEYPMGPCTGIP